MQKKHEKKIKIEWSVLFVVPESYIAVRHWLVLEDTHVAGLLDFGPMRVARAVSGEPLPR